MAIKKVRIVTTLVLDKQTKFITIDQPMEVTEYYNKEYSDGFTRDEEKIDVEYECKSFINSVLDSLSDGEIRYLTLEIQKRRLLREIDAIFFNLDKLPK